MATFTDIKGNLGVKLIITETSQNIPGNTTTISYSARVYKTGSHNPWNHYTQTPFKLMINGETIYSKNANYDLRDWTSASRLSRTEQVIASGTRTITHNANGSKSISVSWSGNFTSTGAGYGYGSVLASDTMKLTDIPRVSKPSLSKTNFNFGESVVLTTNRASANFTHSASYIAGGVETSLATGIGVSKNIVIPISRASSIPNSSSESMKIRVKTFNGATEIGSQDISVTVNVPTTVIPKVDGVTLSETVSKANIFSSNNSNYIRGISKVKTTAINARGEYGSTIVKYEFRLKEDTSYNGTTTSSSFTFGEFRIPSSGSALYSFQCRVQDSRGRYSTWADSTQVRFHYYTPPTISTPGLSRNDTVMSVNRTYNIQSIIENGIERNSGSLSFQSRPKGNASWVTNSGARHTGMNLSNNSASLSGVFLNNIAYEVQGIISDRLNTIYSAISTSGADFVTLEVLLGTGIGVGKSPIAGGANIQIGTEGISSDGKITASEINSGSIHVNGITQEFHKRAIGDTDPSTVTASGAARISAGHSSLPSGSAYSQMLTIHGGGDTISQMVFPYQNTGNPWVRSGNPSAVGGSGSYGPWRKLAFTSDIPSIPSIPTITSGTNDNGNWYNINGVLLICWHRFSITGKLTDSQMNGSWTYPMPFAFTPAVSIGSRADNDPNSSNGYRRAGTTAFHQYNESTTKTDILYAVNNGDVPNNPRKYINIFAIGTPG